MNNLLFAFLQGQAAAPAPNAGQEPQSMLPTIILMVVLFAIVYFFMIRPQSKKQKEIAKFRNSLQVGQDVVTIGGIHGVIKNINDDEHTVTLEVATGTKMVFEKSAIMPKGQAVGQR